MNRRALGKDEVAELKMRLRVSAALAWPFRRLIWRVNDWAVQRRVDVEEVTSEQAKLDVRGDHLQRLLNRNTLCWAVLSVVCLLYTSPSPRDRTRSRMPSSA